MYFQDIVLNVHIVYNRTSNCLTSNSFHHHHHHHLIIITNSPSLSLPPSDHHHYHYHYHHHLITITTAITIIIIIVNLTSDMLCTFWAVEKSEAVNWRNQIEWNLLQQCDCLHWMYSAIFSNAVINLGGREEVWEIHDQPPKNESKLRKSGVFKHYSIPCCSIIIHSASYIKRLLLSSMHTVYTVTSRVGCNKFAILPTDKLWYQKANYQ